MLLLVEHPPVVTLGRSSKEKHLLASPELLAARGVELFEVERGGDVTFHGPGQLVGYPIIDLKRHKQDLHWYLRQVEEALIVALGAVRHRRRAERRATRACGRRGERSRRSACTRATGSRGTASRSTSRRTSSYFDLMVPCGIADVTMTSLERELLPHGAEQGGAELDLWPRTCASVSAAFAELFQLEKTALAPEELLRLASELSVG